MLHATRKKRSKKIKYNRRYLIGDSSCVSQTDGYYLARLAAPGRRNPQSVPLTFFRGRAVASRVWNFSSSRHSTARLTDEVVVRAAPKKSLVVIQVVRKRRRRVKIRKRNQTEAERRIFSTSNTNSAAAMTKTINRQDVERRVHLRLI